MSAILSDILLFICIALFITGILVASASLFLV
jgi:hypothetical protein